MNILLCIILNLCFLFQGDDFLDLTKPIPAVKERQTGKGYGRGYLATDHPHEDRINPFKVTLLNLNKHSYQMGDEFIFEVELENVTNKTVVIPWSANANKVQPDEDKWPPGYMQAYLSLVVSNDPSGDSFLGRGVFGSNLLPGSLKKLEPRHKVKFRVPGRFTFPTGEANRRMLAKLPRNMQVQARYIILDGRQEPTVSTNELTIEVKKRQE